MVSAKGGLTTTNSGGQIRIRYRECATEDDLRLPHPPVRVQVTPCFFVVVMLYYSWVTVEER